jgi:NAD(P)-dependent dehydrogenase (short-subunit alcohol dehydrogenase family)
MKRVFVAGATGAIRKQLVPRLVAAGHEVHGMTRSESKQAMLYDLGAVPVIADALDPDQVAEAVARARPEVIIHQLTAIGALDTRHFDRDFALTNRLRTEGTKPKRVPCAADHGGRLGDHLVLRPHVTDVTPADSWNSGHAPAPPRSLEATSDGHCRHWASLRHLQ